MRTRWRGTALLVAAAFGEGFWPQLGLLLAPLVVLVALVIAVYRWPWILQWHSMLASRVPITTLEGVKYNMIFDGLFHAFTWLVTLGGVILLFRAGMRRERFVPTVFGGAMVLGCGLFNLVEGVIDHQLLGLHHVRPGESQLAWDLAFLASGVVMILLGSAWMRSGRRRSLRSPETPRQGPGLRRPISA